MATHTAPAKSPVPSFVMTAGNVILPLILRSPFHGILSKNMMLLSFKGRKSGKVYTFPVGYARDGAYGRPRLESQLVEEPACSCSGHALVEGPAAPWGGERVA